ncbi:hypothetical protein PR048_017757 [Dryococelus australis]|uniref:Uncharacterized protein n=1 Tax=Dryococelus australis TaxID=614101 RepID=A0ABQ9HAH7_9NEOP|nr:hypothetical protein PR048_017757 [Dryococelus australis]
MPFFSSSRLSETHVLPQPDGPAMMERTVFGNRLPCRDSWEIASSPVFMRVGRFGFNVGRVYAERLKDYRINLVFVNVVMYQELGANFHTSSHLLGPRWLSGFSIPAGTIPGFSQVGVVEDDAAGRRVFSRILRFPRPCIPALLNSHLISPSSVLRTSLLDRPYLRTLSTPTCPTLLNSGIKGTPRVRQRGMANAFRVIAVLWARNREPLLVRYSSEAREPGQRTTDLFSSSPDFCTFRLQMGNTNRLSPPTEANRVRLPADDATDRWVFSTMRSGAAPYSPRFTRIGSQDLDVNSHPNLATSLYPTDTDNTRHARRKYRAIRNSTRLQHLRLTRAVIAEISCEIANQGIPFRRPVTGTTQFPPHILNHVFVETILYNFKNGMDPRVQGQEAIYNATQTTIPYRGFEPGTSWSVHASEISLKEIDDFLYCCSRRVFSWISRFPHLCIPVLLFTHLASPS